MRNNRGFSRFELLVVFVLMMSVVSFLGYITVKITSNQKLNAMKRYATSFSKAVITNRPFFHQKGVIYLEEAVDNNIFPVVKSPFGEGICDPTQSRVDTVDGETYATFRCGDYLINEAEFHDIDNVDVLKVSDWSSEKIEGKNVEKQILYNCERDGELLFKSYSEELLFVYEFNRNNGTGYSYAKEIPDESCKVVSKEFYRTYEKTK